MSNKTSYALAARLLLATAILVEAITTTMPTRGSTTVAPSAQDQAVPQPLPNPQWPEVDQIVQNATAPTASSTDSVALANNADILGSKTRTDVKFEGLPAADAVIIVPSADARTKNISANKMAVQSSKAESSGQPLAQVEFVNVTTNGNPDEAGASLSPLNVAFKLNVDKVASEKALKAASSNSTLKLGVDYSQIDIPYGGDFLERMALYESYDCTFDENGSVKTCATMTPLRGYLDPERKQVVAVLDSSILQRWTENANEVQAANAIEAAWKTKLFFPFMINDAVISPEEPGSPKRKGPPIIIMSAGASSPNGDWEATPLGGVMDYQVGLQSGTASTSYPIPVPAPMAGPAPQIALSYDSGSVDGMSMSRPVQPSSLGVGWDYKPGSIVRLMRAQAAGDLCWTVSGEDFIFSLNGMNSRLVKLNGSQYVLRDDPRWRVEIMTSTVTTFPTFPDFDNRYWQVISPDGTKYRFGGEFEPETGAAQNSIFWVPSFQKYSTSSSCGGSIQNRAWQWNLDRIEDTNGNVMSYFYEREDNYYQYTITTPPTKRYIRSGQVKRIDYTKRAGVAGTKPHARVLFHTEMRCTDPTSVSGCDTAAKYPDTPTDLQCPSNTCSKPSPTFWSYRRLHAIQTQITDTVNGSWKTAGIYELGQTLPEPITDTNNHTTTVRLQLNSITQLPGGDFNWSPYNQIEAESFDVQSGLVMSSSVPDVGAGDYITNVQSGDYLLLKRVNFSEGANLLLARVWSAAAGTSMEVRLDSTANPAIATIAIPNQSRAWKTLTATISSVSGLHDVYLYFTGSAINQTALNWFRFNRASAIPQAIPPMQFGYNYLENRAYTTSNAMFRQMTARLTTITNTLGGITRFTYGQPNVCSPLPTAFDVNTPHPTLDCFIGYYKSDIEGQGDIYWHKYKVVNVNSWDTFSGNPTQTVTYTYSAPTYAFYDDPTTTRKYWNDFRGHMVVTMTLPNGTKTEHRYFRGMDGDTTSRSSYIYSSAVITLSTGTVFTDSSWLRGKEAEVRTLSAANALLNQTRTIYTATLTAGTAGLTGAYFVAPRIITNTDYATTNKTTQTDMVYDNYGNTTQEIHRGDTSTTADDRLIERTFVYSTTPGYMVDNVQSEKLWAGTASGTVGNEQSMTEYAYDGLTIGAIPTKGNATKVRTYTQRTPSALFVEASTGYDTLGRVVSVTDAVNNTSLTGYDATYGYSRIVTNSLGFTATTVIDARWAVPTVVSNASSVITAQYDNYGRRTKVWLPTESISNLASLEYVYDLASRPVNVKSRTLMQVASSTYLEGWTYYDGLGRDLQSQRNDVPGNTRVLTSKRYNGLGQMLYTSNSYSITGAAGSGFVAPIWPNLMSYNEVGYDEQGRQTVVIQKSLTTGLFTTTTGYDGWVTRSYDTNGNRKDSEVDAFGKLAKVTEYNYIAGTGNVTHTTLYGYDLGGSLTRVTDTLGNTTVITYDLAGRKTAMADPNMGAWQYGYDSNGNLTSQRDARGLWLYMEYDGLNRLVRKRKDTSGTGPMLSEWVYDTIKKGLLTKSLAYTPDGTVEVQANGYDARNRATTSQWVVPGTGGGTFRIDYGYDEANHPITTRYPGGNTGQQGEVVTRAFYGVTGQLNTVTSDDSTQFVSATSYNPLGQMIEQRIDSGLNGFTRQASYDPATLRTSVMRAGKNAGYTDLQQLTFSYDANGNIKNVVDGVNSGQRQCYQYDWMNRLTGAFTGDANCTSYNATGIGAYNHAYSYNAVGNITSNAGNSYTYGSAKPHAVTAAFGNTYDYDANGNQITRTVGGTSYAFAYDYEGRLASVSQGTTTLAVFIYDANGNRVKGTISGTTTIYVAGLYEWQNAATTKYYDGGVMRRTGYSTNNGISYLLTDQLGSSNVIVGQNGVAQAANFYYPFGGNRSSSAFSDLTTKRFTGQYHEKGLPGGEGLSYYNARWYDPQLGRFASADTMIPRPNDPQSMNRFAYSRNNPENRIDPSGHADYCNPAIYSCGTSTVSSNPVNHLPWYATYAQRQRAQQVANRMYMARVEARLKLLVRLTKLMMSKEINRTFFPGRKGDDPSHPFELGLEFVSGLGPRQHSFNSDDQFTDGVQRHHHVTEVITMLQTMANAGQLSGGNVFQGAGINYGTGDKGTLVQVLRYLGDGVNMTVNAPLLGLPDALIKGGYPLETTYLGGFSMRVTVMKLDSKTRTMVVAFHVENTTSIGSLTHIPGAYAWSEEHIAAPLSQLRDSIFGQGVGPFASTTQTIEWSERISY